MKKPLLNIALDAVRRFKATRDRVNAFANAHPRFEELGRLIEIGMMNGLDLEQAYAVAEAIASSSADKQSVVANADQSSAKKMIVRNRSGKLLRSLGNNAAFVVRSHVT